MSLPAGVKWVLLALAGLAVAVGVAIAAANLTSQQIGIANESVSAGDALAPALQVPGAGSPQQHAGDRGPDEGTTTAPALPPAGGEGAGEEPAPAAEEPPPSSHGGGGEDHGHGPDGDD